MIWFISSFGHFLTLVPSPLINFGMANIIVNFVNISILTTQLPVPEDFFGDYPELTPEEVDEYVNLAHSWVDGLLEAENCSQVRNLLKENLLRSVSCGCCAHGRN